MSNMTEREKVETLYRHIGEQGLYVGTNYDIFTKKPEEVPLGVGAYTLPLIQPGSKAYVSPLLFATLTSLLNHGTMLVTGAPGIGKTTGVEYAGHFFTGTPVDEIMQSEILGNPLLKTEDVIASLDTVKMVHDGERVVLPTKFLKCPVKIWDEVNRTPADLVSSAMKLVDIGKAVYQGQLMESPPGPLFATANYADEGTFQLTPPFLDRFDVAVMVTSPQPWDLRKIRERGDEKLNGDLDERLRIPEGCTLDFERIRREINGLKEETDYGVPLASAFADFVYGSLRFSEIASSNLARSSKGNAWQVNEDRAPGNHFIDSPFTYTSNEASVRTVQAMQRYAKAFAWMNGKDTVGVDDLKTVLPHLLWHKLQPTQKAFTTDPRFANDRIAWVEDLVTRIETDYNELLGSDALKLYIAALGTLKTGKIGDESLDEEQLRTVVRNAITSVGGVDKPWAITLASHIASEYNSRENGRK
jgi:MoxR-like ATPase